MVQRLEREWTKVELLTTHLKGLETERHQAIQCAADPMATQVRRLVTLRGIGEHSAWVFVAEHFAWRQLRNRRQVGALAGLVPFATQERQVSTSIAASVRRAVGGSAASRCRSRGCGCGISQRVR